ncbi:hypothetical protein LG275_03695 [Chryseomicrobium palamuruense]
MRYQIKSIQKVTVSLSGDDADLKGYTVVEVVYLAADSEAVINRSRLDLEGEQTDEQILQHIIDRGNVLKGQAPLREFALPREGMI